MKPAAEDATPTVDRMRIDIDRGQTGEKVGFEDPAAAPLGTDAEAGGSAPTQAERKLEVKARAAASHSATPRKTSSAAYLLWGAAAATGLLFVFALIS